MNVIAQPDTRIDVDGLSAVVSDDTIAHVIDADRRLISGHILCFDTTRMLSPIYRDIWSRWSIFHVPIPCPIHFCHEKKGYGRLIRVERDAYGLIGIARLSEYGAQMLPFIEKSSLGFSVDWDADSTEKPASEVMIIEVSLSFCCATQVCAASLQAMRERWQAHSREHPPAHKSDEPASEPDLSSTCCVFNPSARKGIGRWMYRAIGCGS